MLMIALVMSLLRICPSPAKSPARHASNGNTPLMMLIMMVISLLRTRPSLLQSPTHTQRLSTQAWRLSRHSLGPGIGPLQLITGLHTPSLQDVPSGHIESSVQVVGSPMSMAPPATVALNLLPDGSAISGV